MVWVTIWAKVRTPSYLTVWPGTKMAALGAKPYFSAGMAWAAPVQRPSRRVTAASIDFAGSTAEPAATCGPAPMPPPIWACTPTTPTAIKVRAVATRTDFTDFIVIFLSPFTTKQAYTILRVYGYRPGAGLAAVAAATGVAAAGAAG